MSSEMSIARWMSAISCDIACWKISAAALMPKLKRLYRNSPV